MLHVMYSVLFFHPICRQVWDLENMLPILTLQRHEKAVHTLAVWQDSVFTGSEDMEIKVLNYSCRARAIREPPPSPIAVAIVVQWNL